MELKEAYEKANNNDKLFHMETDDGHEYKELKKYFYESEVSPYIVLSDKWQIIKHDPKVLTAEESWIERCYPDISPKAKTAYLSGFDDGKPQGKLERDQELMPAIQAAQNYLMSPTTEEREVLEKLLLDIKPL